MVGVKYIFLLAILYVFDQAGGLVTLPKVEENDIVKTAGVIQNTTDVLFSSLKLTNIWKNTRIKQISLLHNYFVSLTLQDYDNLKEIAKLTRVDKSDIENVTIDFIALINEILDEENIIKLQTILIDNDIRIRYGTVKEADKIAFLNRLHAIQFNTNEAINKKVLEILQQEDGLHLNVTTSEANNIDHINENSFDEILFLNESRLFGGRRIFDGKRTKIKHFPFIASIQIFNKFQCAGSIIKSDLVITAASCLQLAWNNRLFRENPPFLSVRVGSSFYEMGGERIGVQEIYFNPGYNPQNLKNNIAIIRLERKIKLKRKKVKKIHLDKEDYKLTKHTGKIDILGWGATSRSNKLHGPWQDKLKYATLDIYPFEECQELYNKEFVTESNFCAGFLSKAAGACNRDLGGPAIISGILVGVISFGSPSCGTPDAPTVLTKVGFYYDWIEDILEQDVPNYKKKTTQKPPTWAYSKPVNQKSTSWTVVPRSILQTSRSHNKTIMKESKSKGLMMSSKKNKICSQNLSNTDEISFIDCLESNETENYLEIEIPKTQHKTTTTTTQNILSISFVTPATVNVYEQIEIQPDIIQPDINLSRSVNSNVKKPLLHAENSGSKSKQLNNGPVLVFNEPAMIKNSPTRLNIKTEDYQSQLNLERNENYEKVLSPNEMSNIEMVQIGNYLPKNQHIGRANALPVENLQNHIKQLVSASAKEQENRVKELKRQIMQIMEFGKTQDNVLKQADNQNGDTDYYIQQVLNSKLKDVEKHDLIMQLVNAKESRVEEVKSKVKISVAKSPKKKEIGRMGVKNILHKIKHILPNNQEHFIKNILTDIKLQDSDKYYSLMQILAAKEPQTEKNSKTNIEPLNLELERNVVQTTEMSEREGAKLKYKENYYSDLVIDSKQQENKMYDFLVQKNNAMEPPKKYQLENTMIESINEAIDEQENENSKGQQIQNGKENKDVKVLRDSDKQSKQPYKLVQLISSNEANIEEILSVTTELNNEVMLNKKAQKKDLKSSILQAINDKNKTDIEIGVMHVLANSNLQDAEKFDLIMQLVNVQKTANVKNQKEVPSVDQMNMVSVKDEPFTDNYDVFTNYVGITDIDKQISNLRHKTQEHYKNQMENVLLSGEENEDYIKFISIVENMQKIINDPKISDQLKYIYLMQTINSNTNTSKDSDTPHNSMIKSNDIANPLEKFLLQLKEVLEAETQEEEDEQEKLVYDQIIQIMNDTEIQVRNNTVKENQVEQLENILTNVLNETSLQKNQQEDHMLLSESQRQPIDESKILKNSILDVLSNSKIQEEEKQDRILQLVNRASIIPETKNVGKNSLAKHIDSLKNTKLDNMLEYIVSFKPKINVDSEQYLKPLPGISQKPVTDTVSADGSVFFDKILYSLAEMDQYTENGLSFKHKNNVVKNQGIALPSFALPMLHSNISHLQKLETEELINILSKLLTPNEAQYLPAGQLFNKVTEKGDMTLSSELSNIGSNFANMNKNLQNVFSLLPLFRSQDAYNNTKTLRQNKDEAHDILNLNMPILQKRAYEDDLNDFLENKQFSKDKIAQILVSLLNKKDTEEGPHRDEKESLVHLLENEHIAKDKIAQILDSLLNKENTEERPQKNEQESLVDLLENKNIAKDKIAQILDSLLSNTESKQYDNFKQPYGSTEENQDWNENDYEKIATTPILGQNKAYSYSIPYFGPTKNAKYFKNLGNLYDQVVNNATVEEYEIPSISMSPYAKQTQDTEISTDKNSHYKIATPLLPVQNQFDSYSSSPMLSAKQDEQLGNLDDRILEALDDPEMKEHQSQDTTINFISAKQSQNVEMSSYKIRHKMATALTARQKGYYSYLSSTSLPTKFNNLDDRVLEALDERQNEDATINSLNAKQPQDIEVSTDETSKSNIGFEKDQVFELLLDPATVEEQKHNTIHQFANDIEQNETDFVKQLDSKYTKKSYRDLVTDSASKSPQIEANLYQRGPLSISSSSLIPKQQEGILKHLSDSLFGVVGGAVNQFDNVLKSHTTIFNHLVNVNHKRTKEETQNPKISSISPLSSTTKQGGLLKNLKDRFFGLLSSADKVKNDAWLYLNQGIVSKYTNNIKSVSQSGTDLERMTNSEVQKSSVINLHSINNKEDKNVPILNDYLEKTKKETDTVSTKYMFNNEFTFSTSTLREEKGGIFENVKDGMFGLIGTATKIKENALRQIDKIIHETRETKQINNTPKNGDLSLSQIVNNTEVLDSEESLLSLPSPPLLTFHQEDNLKKLSDQLLGVLADPKVNEEEKHNALIQLADAVELQRTGNVKQEDHTLKINDLDSNSPRAIANELPQLRAHLEKGDARLQNNFLSIITKPIIPYHTGENIDSSSKIKYDGVKIVSLEQKIIAQNKELNNTKDTTITQSPWEKILDLVETDSTIEILKDLLNTTTKKPLQMTFAP